MEVPVPRRNVLGQERAALGFYNRAKEADEIAAPLEPTIAGMGLASQAGLNYLPNWLQTDLGQSYRQAQRTFTEARLRKESGAAIPNSEYENDSKTYFAQPGDTPQILEQKRIARQEVLDGIGFASGQAFEEFYGEPFKRNSPSAKDRVHGGGEGDAPASVRAVLSAQPDGRYTLSDGSVWIKTGARITKGR